MTSDPYDHPLPAQPPQPRSNKPLGILLAVAAVIIGVCVVLGCIGVAGGVDDQGGDKDGGLSVTTPATNGDPVPLAKPVPAGTPKAAILKAGDLKLAVKTTTKQCFGSAGCNVTFKIKLTVNGDVLANSNRDWAITYEVRGVEGGPQIAELTLHQDGTFEQDSYQFGQTPSRSTKLTAKVTDVEPVL